MRFLKLTIAYDGTGYVGWQVQPNGVSIQQVIELAWQSVTGESRRITASGRTDSGVHALGQAASLETGSPLPEPRLLAALNAHLPEDIRVLAVDAAPLNFHAIRDATSKTYRYCIQHGQQANLFERQYAWHVPAVLNVRAMQEGGVRLVGPHDFSSFQATGSDRLDAIRNISALTVSQRKTVAPFRKIEIEITADGFLYNMVRNIVGTLVDVGRGKTTAEQVSEILNARQRSRAGPAAPAHGLFLVSVEYPATIPRADESLDPSDE